MVLIARAIDRYRAVYPHYAQALADEMVEQYLEMFVDHETESLAWALAEALRRHTVFPTIAHIEALVQEFQADRRREAIDRREALALSGEIRCERCGDTKFVLVRKMTFIRGKHTTTTVAHPCECRPAPPTPRIEQPAGGELAGEIAAAAAGRSM